MTIRITPAEARQLAAAAPKGAKPTRGKGATAAARTSPLVASTDRVVVWVRMLPPTVNHYKLPNGRGGSYLSDDVNLFRSLVAAELYGVAVDLGDARLALRIALTFGTRHRCDIDNRAKSAIDALALALDFDDARIDRLVVERVGYDKGRPACEMTLEVLS